MSTNRLTGAPSWLEDAHEMPVDPGTAPPLWSENYLTYVWSPANEVGIYMHLCRTLVGTPIWNEQMVVVLPGDRYLVSKGQTRGCIGTSDFTICGLNFRVDEPFRQITKTFRGGARLLSRDEYHAGPVQDGAHVPVEWTLTFKAMSPPFDLGSAHLDQAWGVGHFEQHGEITGTLAFNGERHEIDGTGLRDHSWGARDYKDIGTTTWLHGQFPKSGRSLMAVLVTGLAPKPEFRYARVSDREGSTPATASGIAAATTLQETLEGYQFEITDAHGKTSAVTARILNATRAALVGPSEICLGTFSASQANHHYIDAFTRFEWDGEIGYGLTERSVDLT